MNTAKFKYIISKSFGHNTLDIKYNEGNRIITHVNMCIIDTDDNTFITLYNSNVGEITVKVENIIELTHIKTNLSLCGTNCFTAQTHAANDKCSTHTLYN
jgi:hypothetical protein